jgi:2,4'-dihydroxyacetophenone dioxygenase
MTDLSDEGVVDPARIPYRGAQPADAYPELVIPHAIPQDERLWTPQQENVWFRPLCLSASRGYWVNLLRVRKSGVLSHDWVATEGAYVYEAPGETHTLVVDEGVAEMITLFQVNGAMIYVDPDGAVQAYEDVFTKIDMCRKHYAKAGLGEDYVKQFIR